MLRTTTAELNFDSDRPPSTVHRLLSLTFSIITAVRNGAGTIRNCLTSVQSQTVPAEHIVIDGNSTDGTVGILQGAKAPGMRIVSEPDRGIYDAMRKGLERAQGEVIGFLNADDFYATDHVLETVMEALSDAQTDSCYGDLVYVQSRLGIGGTPSLEKANGEFHLPQERIVRRWQAGPMSPRAFHWGWMPPHPTFFVKRSVYQKHGGFRLDLGTAADYELMLRFLVRYEITTRYIPEVLVKMLTGGASNRSLQNRLAANRHDREAWAVNGLRPYPWTLYLKPARKIAQWWA